MAPDILSQLFGDSDDVWADSASLAPDPSDIVESEHVPVVTQPVAEQSPVLLDRQRWLYFYQSLGSQCRRAITEQWITNFEQLTSIPRDMLLIPRGKFTPAALIELDTQLARIHMQLQPANPESDE